MDLGDACVLFDLDGTLIDTARDLTAALNDALAAAGLTPIEPRRVRHLVGQGARTMLAQAFAEQGTAPSAEDLGRHVAVFLDHYNAHIADFSRPFPGAIAAVETLRNRGAAIAICTNKREAPARLLIASLRLDRHFDAIVGMDTVGIGKPDPAPLIHCLKLTDRRRGVFVGDSDTDVQAATAAAMPVLTATFGYGPLTMSGDAFALFHEFAAVPELVARALDAG